ncbi:hypothetical protein ACFQBQ_06715 [Granulicella cerasi]|uniref:Uncharacterized protein n=1 Tax=Granulicella cerasi TaxID=741063 RepID=A0ABW1Z763_9BACT|nr:hypothetical protein [Granulicella cerasi]
MSIAHENAVTGLTACGASRNLEIPQWGATALCRARNERKAAVLKIDADQRLQLDHYLLLPLLLLWPRAGVSLATS